MAYQPGDAGRFTALAAISASLRTAARRAASSRIRLNRKSASVSAVDDQEQDVRQRRGAAELLRGEGVL